MIIALVILVIIAAISIISGIGYRQQVKSISRQLDFLKNHETNMIITGDYGDHSIVELINEINDFLVNTAKLKKISLDKQNYLKDTITSLSHDIRTPLTSLDGYFQLLSQCENAVERERYLEIIQNRIKSLKGMLDELFTYAKLQNDAYELKPEKCCLNKILFDAVFNFYHDFKDAGISPTINICEENLYIIGNEGALTRVFQNIVKNSLEHGQNFIQIEMGRTHDQVSILFSNQFKHTDKINIDQIFDMFYKADSARSRTSTGLGLAIAKELVLRMNGSITVNTADNIFYIIVQFNLAQ
jgi:Signal transduction histidine kinase